MKLRIVLALAALVLAPSLNAQSADDIKIDSWLVLGPADVPGDGAAQGAGAESALDYDFLEPSRLAPEAGRKVRWDVERLLEWRPAAPVFPASGKRQVAYMAVFLESRRWLQADLVVDSAFPIRFYLDGQPLAKADAAGKYSFPFSLLNGRHLLLAKAVLPPQGGAVATTAAPRELKAVLKRKPSFKAAPLSLSLNRERRLAMEDILHAVTIGEVFLAPDGRRVAVSLSQVPRGEESSRRWIEILETEGGACVFTTRGLGEIAEFQWLDDSRRFSFTRATGDLAELCVYDLGDHSCRALLQGLKNFSAYWWAPDASFLVYASSEEAVKDKLYRHVRKLDDRFRTPVPRQALTLFFTASGARQPLSGFADNFSQASISPDGRSLLLAANSEDAKVRPYHRNTWVLVTLADNRREKVLDDPWIHDVTWSPDSRKLLLRGGASAFSGLGSTLPPGVIPNDYDVQAYVYDLKTKKAEALTRQFAPSIDSVFWHPNGSVLLKVIDGQYMRLYRGSPSERKFVRLETSCDSVASVGWSRAGKAVYSGSGLGSPQKLYVLNLGSGSARVLKDYNREAFLGVRFGRAEDWSFKTQEGRTIGGYICYPPDFDPARLWPCIVNFYGGTSPVERDFGGRYPKDWYAANGYIVCVLQPSGAVGYGQEFSSAHVNDWGERTSKEIIRGVEELLRTHPFIDNRRVGAIGASYGGFMTQYLASQTGLFAGLISHAGISALSSYWGVGDWGYNYSAVASADSFPWNRKDIYVGHSPLFMAERIGKPLLLLHGEEDNNVPPGESYQMFAALKLQGKEVAMVTFPGQQHWILKHPQRVQWLKTIMAWFDRWLKGEGEWWQELYPEKD